MKNIDSKTIMLDSILLGMGGIFFRRQTTKAMSEK